MNLNTLSHEGREVSPLCPPNITFMRQWGKHVGGWEKIMFFSLPHKGGGEWRK